MSILGSQRVISEEIEKIGAYQVSVAGDLANWHTGQLGTARELPADPDPGQPGARLTCRGRCRPRDVTMTW